MKYVALRIVQLPFMAKEADAGQADKQNEQQPGGQATLHVSEDEVHPMKLAGSLYVSAIGIAHAPINLATKLLDRITNAEDLKILKSMVEDKVQQVLAEAVFDPCEAAIVAPDILQALDALERRSESTMQWDARHFKPGRKGFLARRSPPPTVEMAELIAMLEDFANYMWLAQCACDRARAKLLKRDDPLRRAVPRDAARSVDQGMPELDRPRYLMPIVYDPSWTEQQKFEFLHGRLLRVAEYTKRFAVDQRAAIEATRHEGGKVYGPYEVWTAVAQLMGLAIVTNATCVTLALIPTASSVGVVSARSVVPRRPAVESESPQTPPALPTPGS